jgi:hypothetical protein
MRFMYVLVVSYMQPTTHERNQSGPAGVDGGLPMFQQSAPRGEIEVRAHRDTRSLRARRSDS